MMAGDREALTECGNTTKQHGDTEVSPVQESSVEAQHDTPPPFIMLLHLLN